MNHLMHYGVKGQEWGKRRFQNPDGSLTELGRVHYGVKSKDSDVEDILNSMSKKDKKLINIASDDEIKSYSHGGPEYFDVVKRFVEKDTNNIPVSFLDFQDVDGRLSVTIGTRGGEAYRNKGYASKISAKGMDWISKNSDQLSLKYSEILWIPKARNKGSRKLAEKNGFVLKKSLKNYIPGATVTYKKSIK